MSIKINTIYSKEGGLFISTNCIDIIKNSIDAELKIGENQNE